jgi:hypothetical protein
VGEILKRLAVLDEERVELLTLLRTMGFRTRGLVGEYGELLAAALYHTPLTWLAEMRMNELVDGCPRPTVEWQHQYAFLVVDSAFDLGDVRFEDPGDRR